ncbi:hypothetical protein SAMN04487970_101595 [Paenibacillus tianmuensis]|uniref:Uncharacterized protein n=1 Tax=Paenibacillus tianmuensis TaxID=624147 RepID=A0A1G4RI33_9BACL|nr:hypothetical protein [Paenibacillus tianmuensis]SCW56165.1 hypothetical protein SAMN04487970_101595 [Paenibacillus tianmuensis]
MAIVLANIGTSDVQRDGSRIPEEERLNAFNFMNEDLLGQTNVFQPEFPIMRSIEKLLSSKEEYLEYLILFYTEQEGLDFRSSDTYKDFEFIRLAIAQQKLFESHNPILLGYPIHKAPYSYDRMFFHYRQAMEQIMRQLTEKHVNLNQPFYVSVAGGTPACNFGLLHAVNATRELPRNKQFIYSPRPARKEDPQPPAVEIEVDAYLSVDELLYNFRELFEGHHYGQIKKLLESFKLLQEKDVTEVHFLDALLLRKNLQYDKAVQKLNRITNADFKKEAFFNKCFVDTQSLMNGIKINEEQVQEKLHKPEIKRLLEEQYWKLENYYALEQYNDWVTMFMNLYENMLRLKAIDGIGTAPNEHSSGQLREAIRSWATIHGVDSLRTDDFICGKRRYPTRHTYEKIVSALEPDSLLGKNSPLACKLDHIYEERNNLIHRFGGLTKEVIKDTFSLANWQTELKGLLHKEFHCQLKENPLTEIHDGFLHWLRHRLHQRVMSREMYREQGGEKMQ